MISSCEGNVNNNDDRDDNDTINTCCHDDDDDVVVLSSPAVAHRPLFHIHYRCHRRHYYCSTNVAAVVAMAPVVLQWLTDEN
jgi:hypothetical protein